MVEDLVKMLNRANPVLPADHGIRTTTAWTTMDWGILRDGVRQYPWGTVRVFEYEAA